MIMKFINTFASDEGFEKEDFLVIKPRNPMYMSMLVF